MTWKMVVPTWFGSPKCLWHANWSSELNVEDRLICLVTGSLWISGVRLSQFHLVMWINVGPGVIHDLDLHLNLEWIEQVDSPEYQSHPSCWLFLDANWIWMPNGPKPSLLWFDIIHPLLFFLFFFNLFIFFSFLL